MYPIIRNFLLFFFLIRIFSGVEIFNGLVGEIVVAFLFGILMSSVPTLLKFFKLPVNFAGMLLLGMVVTFVFYFLLLAQFLNLGTVNKTVIDWGIKGISPLMLDEVATLVVISIVSAILSVWLDSISGVKRK